MSSSSLRQTRAVLGERREARGGPFLQGAGGWGRGRAGGSDPLLPQNGELTMLGEITHLQGIIDDLVVLTAEPHKLPPASEQVRPVLELGDRGGDDVLLVGDSRGKKRTEDQTCPNTVGHPGAPAQGRGGVPRTQWGPQSESKSGRSRVCPGLTLNKPDLVTPVIHMQNLSPPLDPGTQVDTAAHTCHPLGSPPCSHCTRVSPT